MDKHISGALVWCIIQYNSVKNLNNVGALEFLNTKLQKRGVRKVPPDCSIHLSSPVDATQ